MRLRRTGWVGLTLIAIGVVPLVGWTVWFRTRTWCPVDMPVSLAQGSHLSTPEFNINLTAQYAIDINSENKLPLDTLECLLGSEFPPEKCHIPSVVRVQWTLHGDGMAVQGKSDDTGSGYGGSGLSGEAFRTIGFFRSEKGRRYRLDIDVLADGSRLTVTNPHLRVRVFDTKYESGLVLSGLLRLACGTIGLAGAALLLLSVLKQRRRSHPLFSEPRPVPGSA
jgi:hypothetical protein